MTQPIGNLLDSLGITHTPEDGELVPAAIAILKTVDSNGAVGLRLAWSDGMSWIERLGMLHASLAMESPAPDYGTTDDD